MDEILLFLRAQDADILLLQEVYDGRHLEWERKFRSMEVLQDALGYSHVAFAPAFMERTEFGKIEQGNAVFSRFPIKEHPTVFFDEPYAEREDIPEYYERTPRNLQHVEIDVQGESLHVFNTQGVWGTDGNDNPRRLAMGKTIANAIAPYERVLLGGDMNVQEGTQTIDLIEEHLTPLFKGERTTSFNLRHKSNPGYASAIVDMLFVSPGIEVVSHMQHEDNVSDHLALSATINW